MKEGRQDSTVSEESEISSRKVFRVQNIMPAGLRNQICKITGTEVSVVPINEELVRTNDLW